MIEMEKRERKKWKWLNGNNASIRGVSYCDAF
jgi:hypothetical protein